MRRFVCVAHWLEKRRVKTQSIFPFVYQPLREESCSPLLMASSLSPLSLADYHPANCGTEFSCAARSPSQSAGGWQEPVSALDITPEL